VRVTNVKNPPTPTTTEKAEEEKEARIPHSETVPTGCLIARGYIYPADPNTLDIAAWLIMKNDYLNLIILACRFSTSYRTN